MINQRLLRASKHYSETIDKLAGISIKKNSTALIERVQGDPEAEQCLDDLIATVRILQQYMLQTGRDIRKDLELENMMKGGE